MMSVMEQNAQIGELVTQRQAQKIALEHLNLKTSKISAAYSGFAYTSDRWCVDGDIEGGTVFLMRPKPEEREYPRYLLNKTELALPCAGRSGG